MFEFLAEYQGLEYRQDCDHDWYVLLQNPIHTIFWKWTKIDATDVPFEIKKEAQIEYNRYRR